MIIWNKTKETTWIPRVLHTFDDVIWHVSFNVTGSVLAVSGGDNEVGIILYLFCTLRCVCIDNMHASNS